MLREKTYYFLMYIVLTIVLVFTVFPLFYTISASFKSNMEILLNTSSILPIKPTLDNYRIAFTSQDFNVLRLTLNSLYYTAFNVVTVVLSSAMGGYVFARGEFIGKKVIFAVFTSLMFINLGSITVYPLFNIVNFLGLNKSLSGLIVVRIFSINIVNMYLVRSYVKTLPKELDEAAEIDGCGFVKIFFRIIAPLLKPILATVAILSFQASWNDYLMPTIFTLGNPSARTLIAGVVALKNTGNAASAWNLMLAGSAISVLPVIVAYTFANKYFVSGLASGAVKG